MLATHAYSEACPAGLIHGEVTDWARSPAIGHLRGPVTSTPVSVWATATAAFFSLPGRTGVPGGGTGRPDGWRCGRRSTLIRPSPSAGAGRLGGYLLSCACQRTRCRLAPARPRRCSSFGGSARVARRVLLRPVIRPEAALQLATVSSRRKTSVPPAARPAGARVPRPRRAQRRTAGRPRSARAACRVHAGREGG